MERASPCAGVHSGVVGGMGSIEGLRDKAVAVEDERAAIDG